MRPTNECTSTSADQFLGSWQGQESTVIAYWPEPEISDCQLELGAAELEGLVVQPDGGFARLPERVSHRGRLCSRAAGCRPRQDGASDLAL